MNSSQVERSSGFWKTFGSLVLLRDEIISVHGLIIRLFIWIIIISAILALFMFGYVKLGKWYRERNSLFMRRRRQAERRLRMRVRVQQAKQLAQRHRQSAEFLPFGAETRKQENSIPPDICNNLNNTQRPKSSYYKPLFPGAKEYYSRDQEGASSSNIFWNKLSDTRDNRQIPKMCNFEPLHPIAEENYSRDPEGASSSNTSSTKSSDTRDNTQIPKVPNYTPSCPSAEECYSRDPEGASTCNTPWYQWGTQIPPSDTRDNTQIPKMPNYTPSCPSAEECYSRDPEGASTCNTPWYQWGTQIPPLDTRDNTQIPLMPNYKPLDTIAEENYSSDNEGTSTSNTSSTKPSDTKVISPLMVSTLTALQALMNFPAQPRCEEGGIELKRLNNRETLENHWDALYKQQLIRRK